MRITLGLAGLLLSVLLGAMVFHLVPDQRQAVIEGRSRLCEAMAVNSSVMVSRDDLRRLKATLTVMVERHEDILSAGVRRLDGTLVVAIADHAEEWKENIADLSDDSQIYVPLQSAEGKWGGLEVRFEPLHGNIFFEIRRSPWLRLIGFVMLGSFGLWYWYLGKVLEQMHPSQAVPRRVRSALDTLAEGLLVLDRKARIVLCNQSLAQVLGGDPEAIVGRAANKLPWVIDPEATAAKKPFPWETVLQSEAPFATSTLRLVDVAGDTHIYQSNCSPVVGQEGKTRGVVCSFEDVTELETQKVELAESKATAEAANQAKSEFLANMSHEIRTPMNAILGFTEVLRRGMYDSDEQRSEYVETIRSSGQHLLRLLNDILDLSKVEAGKLEVERIACSPLELLVEVATVLKVRADERGIFLKVEAPQGLPERVETDPGRVRQIVTNLIGNALKFTEQGGVTVVAEVLHQPKLQLRIDVIDTGVGIPESSLEKIFQPFTQADGSVTRKFGGTGLGLTISRQFAQALGGDITVTSTVGAGSTFSVTIGLPELLPETRVIGLDEFLATRRSSRRAIVTGQRYQFPPCRILLVDDTEANRQLIQLFLVRNNLNVETASNGQEAIDAASRTEFDVILMDMQMPVMDGETATRILRDRGHVRPIVALTAGAMKGDEEKCRAAGCSGFLTKPVDLDELLAYLAEIVGGVPTSDAPAVPTIRPSVELPSVSVLTPVEPSQPRQQQPSNGVTNSLCRSAANGESVDQRANKLAVLSRVDEALAALRETEDLQSLPHSSVDAASKLTHAAMQSTAAAPGRATPEEQLLEQVKSVSAETSSRLPTSPRQQATTSERGAAAERFTRPKRAPIKSSLPLNDDEFVKIVANFVDKLRTRVIELDAACERLDFEEIGRLAHWLKGSAGTVGFREFCEPSVALMQMAKEQRSQGISRAMQEIREMVDVIVVPEPAT